MWIHSALMLGNWVFYYERVEIKQETKNLGNRQETTHIADISFLGLIWHCNFLIFKECICFLKVYSVIAIEISKINWKLTTARYCDFTCENHLGYSRGCNSLEFLSVLLWLFLKFYRYFISVLHLYICFMLQLK